MAEDDERCFRNPYLVDPACDLSFDGKTEKPEVSCKYGHVEISRGLCMVLYQTDSMLLFITFLHAIRSVHR
jgi:hypothetical protein